MDTPLYEINNIDINTMMDPEMEYRDGYSLNNISDAIDADIGSRRPNIDVSWGFKPFKDEMYNVCPIAVGSNPNPAR